MKNCTLDWFGCFVHQFRRNSLGIGRVIIIHIWSVRGTKREFAWRFFKNKGWREVYRIVYAPFVLAFFFVHATPSARHKFAGGTKRNETQEGASRALCLASRDNINEPISPPPFFHPLFKTTGEKVIVSFFLSFFLLLSLLYRYSFLAFFFPVWPTFLRMTLARTLNNVPRTF